MHSAIRRLTLEVDDNLQIGRRNEGDESSGTGPKEWLRTSPRGVSFWRAPGAYISCRFSERTIEFELILVIRQI